MLFALTLVGDINWRVSGQACIWEKSNKGLKMGLNEGTEAE